MQVGPKWKALFKFLLKAAVTVLAFWWISGKISWADTFNALRKAQIWLLVIALILFNASKIVSALRLELFWEAIHVSLSRKKNLALYYLGMFYNLFLPGGIGGDGYKVWLLNKSSEAGVKKLAQAVIIDRITGLIPLTLLAAILLWTTSVSPGITWWMKVGLLLLAVLGYIISYFIIGRLFPVFKPPFHKAALQGAGVQVLQAICAVCIVLALGVHESVLSYLFLFLVSSIIAVLPLTIGGVGAREWFMVVGCQWFALDKENGVAVGLIFFLITAVSSLPGGFLPASWYRKEKENGHVA